MATNLLGEGTVQILSLQMYSFSCYLYLPQTRVIVGSGVGAEQGVASLLHSWLLGTECREQWGQAPGMFHRPRMPILGGVWGVVVSFSTPLQTKRGLEQWVNAFCPFPKLTLSGTGMPWTHIWEVWRALPRCSTPLPDQTTRGVYRSLFLQKSFSQRKDLPGVNLEDVSAGVVMFYLG